MSIFDTFKAALTGKATTAADLATSVMEAARVRDEASAEVARLEGERRDKLTAPDAERAKHKAALAAATDRAADAALYLEGLQAKHAEAETREAEAVRQRAYDAARAASDAAAKALVKEYPDAAKRILLLLKQVTEAEILVEAVNKNLPAAAVELIGPEESARTVAGVAREVISEREVELWCDQAGVPLPDAMQSTVKVDEAGRGYRSFPGSAHVSSGTVRCMRRRFRRVEYREGTHARRVEPLADKLRLPGLTADDPPLWSRGNFGDLPAAEALEASLAYVRKPPRPEPREVQVELVPIAPEPVAARQSIAA